SRRSPQCENGTKFSKPSTKRFVVFSIVFWLSLANADIPLFEHFPELKRAYPRVDIIKGKTPLDPLSNLEKELGLEAGRLLIKRDDISDQLLGGNKARKLEFIFGEI